eukprot:CAMPEP_0174894448 /NCGR_PEP_ID=MMETSP0167-20121228/9086_1 /TAXON_ID=38298 /ORGANISM="Rhodella maculata, Strain CCMP736" /LENGTH=87 /DNA_ID=CAMNT_0016133537 /DNA_START=98 /DNA_END=362 /DNA_ORIENTATION=+
MACPRPRSLTRHSTPRSSPPRCAAVDDVLQEGAGRPGIRGVVVEPSHTGHLTSRSTTATQGGLGRSPDANGVSGGAREEARGREAPR